MIGSEEELRSRFGEVHPLAIAKARPALDRYSRQFIGLSPFLVISTADAQGRADLSPRGDPPGFVRIVDDRTILIPDRPGNNRLDTMANIMANPNVGCLFFVPGFEDTLRLNGKASITDDAELLRPCTVNGKPPRLGILVGVEEVFLHCAKALKRSKLWEPDYRQDRRQMPSIARIIMEQACDTGVDEREAARADAEVEVDYRTGLY
ncbi:pyridoxamine 5'-phosphate oxidase family protein [Aestuariivirga sp.]|uniref:pyridoxamine 5'-phosphate oxidase family protein n=1 Tax=Aestuariivirga sp. TaxID=2650926 RepID=UPI00391A7924